MFISFLINFHLEFTVTEHWHCVSMGCYCLNCDIPSTAFQWTCNYSYVASVLPVHLCPVQIFKCTPLCLCCGVSTVCFQNNRLNFFHFLLILNHTFPDCHVTESSTPLRCYMCYQDVLYKALIYYAV